MKNKSVGTFITLCINLLVIPLIILTFAIKVMGYADILNQNPAHHEKFYLYILLFICLALTYFIFNLAITTAKAIKNSSTISKTYKWIYIFIVFVFLILQLYYYFFEIDLSLLTNVNKIRLAIIISLFMLFYEIFISDYLSNGTTKFIHWIDKKFS